MCAGALNSPLKFSASFVLDQVKELMRVFRRQAEENFCNHIWAAPFDLVAEQRQKQQSHTEL